jgi:hypothetical protein
MGLLWEAGWIFLFESQRQQEYKNLKNIFCFNELLQGL